MINEDLLLEIVTCKLGTFEEAMYMEKTGKLVSRQRTKNEANVQERENKTMKHWRAMAGQEAQAGLPGPCEAASCLFSQDPEFTLRLYNNAFGFKEDI